MNSETKKALKSEIKTIDVNLKKLQTELNHNEVQINNLLRIKKTLADKIGGQDKKKREILEDLQKEEKDNA